MLFLGLGKTLYNSSACLLRPAGARPEIELVLSERILRQKASGVWPAAAIRKLEPQLQSETVQIAENRDVMSPLEREELMDRGIPFFDHLAKEGLGRYSRRLNPELSFVTHHRCHAMAATLMSPFEKCVIVVMDGAGSKLADFPGTGDEGRAFPDLGTLSSFAGELTPESHEECSVYLHDRGKLRCVFKRWREFIVSDRHPNQVFSDGVGIMYEKAAEFVFNSNRAAGKLMGLAPFGKPYRIEGGFQFLESLNWTLSFTGKGKREWESSARLPVFADVAATVQMSFEENLFELMKAIRSGFPDYDRLIMTGGCALNCTGNMKLLEKGWFEEIYVPPFPGDESIGLGGASFLYHEENSEAWSPWPHAEQHGYFGPRDSLPTEAEVGAVFAGMEIIKPPSITEYCAGLLSEGRVIGWFQGRSESGPRALGNRSILADPRVPEIKDRLNRDIKLRESFRPYGASCLHEKAHEYFDVPPGFNSPYMSFAVRTRPSHFDLLREVTHIDGTSRIQTVRKGQNARFHELLENFGEKSGHFCLLNTSLNVMGEPIVETVKDARRFLEHVPVYGLAIGDFFVLRKRERIEFSQTSVDMLEENCSRVLIEKKTSRAIWFPDKEILCPGIPADHPADVVFFGNFVRRFLSAEAWVEGRFRLWTLGSAAKSVMTDVLGVPPEKIGVIPRSVLFPSAIAPSKFPSFTTPTTLVFAGRISPTKNIESLIWLTHFLQTKWGLPATLALIGDFDDLPHPDRPGRESPGGDRSGAYENRLRTLISELEWKSEPRFFPRLSPDVWLKRDFVNPVFVSLSTFLFEDFGVSAAQARAAGWPCLLSDWGGHVDVSGEGVRKIPADLIGRSHDFPEQIKIKALRLTEEVIEIPRSDGFAEKGINDDAFASPEVISSRELAHLRKRFLSSSPPEFMAIYQDGLETFARQTVSRPFFEKYHAAFSGKGVSR